MSYTARRTVGGRTYLEERESYRENGKVKVRFLRYLGAEGEERGKPRRARHLLDQLRPSGSYRAGDVGLLWALAQDLKIPTTIDGICGRYSDRKGPTPGTLLTVWAINRVLHPESATQLERWVPTTDLPRLTGIPPEAFTKDAFLTCLDRVCGEDPDIGGLVDRTERLDEELFRAWRERHPLPAEESEVFAYDLTSVLFFGVTCPLAELGYNAQEAKGQMQVNLAMLVTRRERQPVTHSVFEGSRHGAATVRNFLVRVLRLGEREEEKGLVPKGGTLIWDRGVVSKDHVLAVEAAGWQLVCGLPKTLSSVKAILDRVEVPWRPETLVRRTKVTTIYAVGTEAEVYGTRRRLAVYMNMARAQRERDHRNESLAMIGEELEKLSKEGAEWKEAKLHARIAEIVGGWRNYVEVRVSRKGEGPRVSWRLKQQAVREAERQDGKWVLLATDPKRTVKEVVEAYLEKDFIEKVFRHMKTEEELEPVRHRLERRVRAYLFVLTLAYRLWAALQWYVETHEVEGDGNSWEVAEDLLKALGRVERVEVALGKQRRVWHLNLLKGTKEDLKKLGYGGLFREESLSALPA